MKRRAVWLAAIGALFFVAGTDMVTPAKAQGVCEQLWYERNSIYARNGYCFRTARARAVFGPGCFPPYGRLSYYEQRRVEEIQYQEDIRGCPR